MPETKVESTPAILRRELYPAEIQCKANSGSAQSPYEFNNLTNHTTERIRYVCPNKLGEIVRIVHIWFSAGCQNYVHLFIYLNGGLILPSSDPQGSTWVTGGLIGDDMSRPIPADLKLRKGDTLQAKYINTDSTNDHTVVITLEIEKVRAKEPKVEEPAAKQPEKAETEKPLKKVIFPQVDMSDLRETILGPLILGDASGIGGDASDAGPVIETEDSSQV